jgi:hypothetical protein
MSMSRRQFIMSGVAAAAWTTFFSRYSYGRVPGLLSATPTNGRPRSARPIQPVDLSQLNSVEFNGDDVERSHEILWNVDGAIKRYGGLPQACDDVRVVVIGGGVAGLTAAHFLSNYKPVVLEQDRVFGGNSKGEDLEGSRYSIGAAYLASPTADTETGKLLTELGLWNAGRRESSDETTVFKKGNFAPGFWKGVTDSHGAAQFERVFQDLVAMREKFDASEGGEDWGLELDRITFEKWLENKYGHLHPHLREYFQLYAWSSFSASIDEVSAYQMLGFLAYETGELIAFPGGNSAIVDRLYQKLVSKNGQESLRSGAIVVDVRKVEERIRVTYLDSSYQLKTLRAEACIFAAPKFVARKVLRDLTPEQESAMAQLKYRGYVVANVILDRPAPSPSFELYCLEGTPPPSPSAIKPSPRAFTDICFGTWAQHEEVKRSVLTIYKGFAFDGDRQFLFSPLAHDKHKTRILGGMDPMLHALGLKKENIAGIRLTRWGHCMPVAQSGLIASGLVARASAPIGGRLFFANQDNLANPAFETAINESRKAADLAIQVLGG